MRLRDDLYTLLVFAGMAILASIGCVIGIGVGWWLWG